MPIKKLILLLVLLLLGVVGMTIGTWYLIKAVRFPSAEVSVNSPLADEYPVAKIELFLS